LYPLAISDSHCGLTRNEKVPSCQDAKEYEVSIIQKFFDQENAPSKHIGFNCEGRQGSEVSDRERAYIINWLVNIHNRLKDDLRQETLHITVNLIDRILAKHNVPVNKLKLLGITCFFIATKFEDIATPSAGDLIIMAQIHRQVFIKDIHALELKILSSLDFDVQFPTTYQFFMLFCNLVNASNTHRVFGQFILEIALLERAMILNKKPSLIAFGAIYLVSSRLVKSEPTKKKCRQILEDLNKLLHQ